MGMSLSTYLGQFFGLSRTSLAELGDASAQDDIVIGVV